MSRLDKMRMRYYAQRDGLTAYGHMLADARALESTVEGLPSNADKKSALADARNIAHRIIESVDDIEAQRMPERDNA